MNIGRWAVPLACLLPCLAVAGEPAWSAGDSAIVDGWEPEVELFVRTNSLGFEPSRIISKGGENVIDGAELRPAAAEVRSRIAVRGKYLQLELQVYTQIPSNVLMVTTGGLEAWLLAPLTERVRVGLYHNSAHNFSDGQYGGGTDVNSVVLDALIVSRRFRLLDDDLQLRVRANGYFMLKGMTSPYAFTPAMYVARPDIGDTAWRASTLVEAAHRYGRANLLLTVYGAENWVPASMAVTAWVGLRPGRKFLGIIGEHLLVGPYLTYRRNFGRIEDFGADTYSAGIRFDLLITEDPFLNRKQ